MKYKVGDRVKIQGVIDHRNEYNGKEVTIKTVNPNGTTGFYAGKTHYGVGEHYIFYENELTPVNNRKIVITTDGAETLAQLYEGNKVIKTATAKCNPIDTFDFKVGAELAFERLMIAEEKKPNKKNIKFNDGDYARITANTSGHNFAISTIVKLEKHTRDYKAFADGCYWWVVDDDLSPVERLLFGNAHYGYIGEKTNYKDVIGRPLCVGDVVEHFADADHSYGDTVIVKAKLSYMENKEKVFVMGIESQCNDKNGTTGDWKIIKKRSFEEVADNEAVNGIRYVKSI